MTDSNDHQSDNTKHDDSIKIISVDDEKTKTIGEILSNDSSRKILKLLTDNEMTANQISQKTDLSIALVAFHLKKMQDVDIVKTTKTAKSVKGQEMKYYCATKKSLLITPAKHTDTILESIKRYSRFAAIGIAGLASWIILRKDVGTWNSGEEIPITLSDPDIIIKEPRPTLPPSDFMHGEDASSNYPVPSPEPSHSGVQELNPQVNTPDTIHLDKTVYPVPFGTSVESIEPIILSLLIPIVVIISGVIIDRVLSRWIIKKRLTKYDSKDSNRKYQ